MVDRYFNIKMNISDILFFGRKSNISMFYHMEMHGMVRTIFLVRFRNQESDRRVVRTCRFVFFLLNMSFSIFDSGMWIYRQGKRDVVARLAVQKVMDSIKKIENGIIKIRYLLGCGVNTIKKGGGRFVKFLTFV